MTLRVAVASDLEPIQRIDNWVLQHPGARERFLRALETGAVVVAEDDDRMVGHMAIEFGFFGHTFVAFLCVDAHERRRGIASALLCEAERLARKAKVFASTTASNAAMQRVFDRNGWRRVGSLMSINDEEPGGDEPELIYCKSASW